MKSKQWFLGSRIIFSFYWLLMSVVTAQAAPELSIGHYQLVESKRISRTVFEYSYKGTATNTGSDALDVSATLNIDNPGITIIKNSLSFGDLATNVDIASSDTFTIRHDRSFSFSTDELQWTIQATAPPEPEPIVLNELAPTIATTGSEFLVTGTGFTTESKVLLNGAAIPTTYVSETILKAIVPFTADELGMLLPYPAGNFAVEVNGSNSLILEVSELPENHQPRGQILNEIAETLAIDFRQNSSDFHEILPQLLTDAVDEPELKAFINDLSEFIDHVDSSLLNELPQSINELDNQTINTLERALVAKRQTVPAGNSLGVMSQSAGPVAMRQMAANASSAGFDGDQWLLKRKGNAEIANGLNTYNSILGICTDVSALLVASPSAPAAAPVLAFCASMYITGKVAEIIITLNQSITDGQIRELKLALKDRPDDFFDHRQITLNNFDNNEILSKQTTNANYITSAKIGINYRPDWCNIATDIASLFSLPAKKISDAIKNKVKETIGKLLCKESDRSFNEPTDVIV